MTPIALRSIPENLVVTFTGSEVALPSVVQARIDIDWQERIAKNPKLQNGEVFSAVEVEQDASGMHIKLAATNYAHYLYSQQYQNLGEYTVRIIHPAAMVITSDNKLIFGAMGQHTSRPGIIQCCGGGIDFSDIVDDKVQVENCITREIKEELNIDPYDLDLVLRYQPAYLKTGGPTEKMTVIYLLQMKLSSAEFLRHFENYIDALKKRGEDSEFDALFCVERDTAHVDEFISEHNTMLNEYMPGLLREMCKIEL
jgi:8-oxo-dGTP pyrophosphatase MutT (NUDIX family)